MTTMVLAEQWAPGRVTLSVWVCVQRSLLTRVLPAFDPLSQSAPRRLPASWESSRGVRSSCECGGRSARSCGYAGRYIDWYAWSNYAFGRAALCCLEQYDPLWLEEPCPPENYKQMGEIARRTIFQSPPASGWWGFMNFRTCLSMEVALLLNRTLAVVVV